MDIFSTVIYRFPSAKRTILHKLKIAIDYSPKGSIDEGIVDLVHFINKLPNYVTTSSCAGRISLYGYHTPSSSFSSNNNHDNPDQDNIPANLSTATVSKAASTKGNGKWIYVNHGTASYTAIQTVIDESRCSEKDDPSSIDGAEKKDNKDDDDNDTATDKFPYVTLLVEPFILHTQCSDIEAARKFLRIAMDAGYRESGIGIGGKGKIIVAVRSTSGMLEIPIRYNGDTLIDHEILEKIVKIANDTYTLNEIRRERFESLVKQEFLITESNIVPQFFDKQVKQTNDEGSQTPPVTDASTKVLSLPSVSSSNNTQPIQCSTCKQNFPSRNYLFKNHLVPSTHEGNGKRVCPEPIPDSSTNTSKVHVCTTCNKTFSSRNALFRHIKMKDKECILLPSMNILPPTNTNPSSSEPTATLSNDGRQIAQEVHEIMQKYLKKVHSEQELFYQQFHKQKQNEVRIFVPGTEENNTDSTMSVPPELFYRWGHTAVALSSKAIINDAHAVRDSVVVFGGYVGTGIHGRRNDILFFHDSKWSIPTLIPNNENTVPRSRIRHTAVSTTIPIATESSVQYIPGMFTFGGHDGPTKPLQDGWFLQMIPQVSSSSTTTTNTVSFQAKWNPVTIVSDNLPTLSRWAHTLTPFRMNLSDDNERMILFGGRNQVQSFNDIHVLSLENSKNSTNDNLVLSAYIEQLPCIGKMPLPRFGHTAGTLTLSSNDDQGSTKSTALIIHGGFVSQFLYGAHGTNTIRFGDDVFRTDIDKYGPSMQLLNDVHVLRIIKNTENTLQGVWCQVELHGSPLQPRFSHTMTNISETQLVIFGGECYDPSLNQGYVMDASDGPNFDTQNLIVHITVKSLPRDGISYGNYFHDDSHSPLETSTMISINPTSISGTGTTIINPYRWRIHPIANLSSEYLPLALRHTVTYLPASKSTPNGSLVLVGGGAVCFAFGAQYSRACVGDVTHILENSSSMVTTTPKETLVTASVTEETWLPALVLPKDKGHWVTKLLQSYHVYDPNRTAKIVDTLPLSTPSYPTIKNAQEDNENINTKNLIAIPILASQLPWLQSSDLLHHNDPDIVALAMLLHQQQVVVWLNSPLPISNRSSLSKHEKLSSQSLDSFLGSDDLYAIIEASLKRKPSVLPKVPKITPRSGTGPIEIESFISIVKILFAKENIPSEKYTLLVPGAIGGIPKRLEWVGDILMLPVDAMTDPVWLTLGGPSSAPSASTEINVSSQYRIVTAPIWDIMAKVFRTTRIGRTNVIDTTITRQSKVVVLRTVENRNAYSLPPVDTSILQDYSLTMEDIDNLYPVPDYSKLEVGTGGWVTIKENNLYYTLDVTRVMFSSGNITEKTRMGTINVTGETIVDLFAGIGYFTLPLLVKGNAKHVHAVDINPDAIACLRINLRVNQISTDRYTLWPGNNRSLLQRAPHLRGTADRVLLGFIPTSEAAWSIAVQLLKPQGGILHIHINKGEEEIDEFIAKSPYLFENLNKYSNRLYHGILWKGKVMHVEKVKSYAPRVWHYVIDLELREIVME